MFLITFLVSIYRFFANLSFHLCIKVVHFHLSCWWWSYGRSVDEIITRIQLVCADDFVRKLRKKCRRESKKIDSNYTTSITMIIWWSSSNLSDFAFYRFKYSIPILKRFAHTSLIESLLQSSLVLFKNWSRKRHRQCWEKWNYYRLHKLMAPSSITDYRSSEWNKTNCASCGEKKAM